MEQETNEKNLAELKANMYANNRLHIANRKATIERDYWKNIAKQFIDEIDIQNNYNELSDILIQNGFVNTINS